MSVPVTMNLTEYNRCTSKLATNYPISKFKQGKGKTIHVTGVLMLGPGLMPLLDKVNLVPGKLLMGAHSLS